jgi:hypothetical protein
MAAMPISALPAGASSSSDVTIYAPTKTNQPMDSHGLVLLYATLIKNVKLLILALFNFTRVLRSVYGGSLNDTFYTIPCILCYLTLKT